MDGGTPRCDLHTQYVAQACRSSPILRAGRACTESAAALSLAQCVGEGLYSMEWARGPLPDHGALPDVQQARIAASVLRPEEKQDARSSR